MYINLITIDLCPGQGGVKPSGSLEISENGVYDVYSYSSASVDVHPSASLSETYISNGNYNITGEFNGGVITVDVPAPQFVTETLNVSANGTYNPGEGVDGYSQVNVNVPATQFITETLSVSENGTYTPSEGVDGYSQVVVDVPQSVTGIDEKDYTEGNVKIVNLSNSASFVASSLFLSNSVLQTINLPNCKYVGESAFWRCSLLSQISLPVCEYIRMSAFDGCSSLSQVNLPVCSYISYNAFYSCRNLAQVSLPRCEYIETTAFNRCTLLTQVILPVCSHLGERVFYDINHSSFSLTLGYSGICTLEGKLVYDGIISNLSIFVPASLVDTYKSATNWSKYSSRIFPISE